MKIEGWRYYNHAAIPTTAPHEDPDLTPIEDKSIWQLDGDPLLARWTTDFDLDYETNWWYIIKRAPFLPETLDPKVRKHIRQAFKKVEVKQIEMPSYAEALSVVYNKACKGYKDFFGGLVVPDNFKNRNPEECCFAAFSTETGDLIGYMICIERQGYTETITAKYDPEYLKLRVSDAIHYVVLDYYLNKRKVSYVSSGARTVNHETNAQTYKITTFGFEKAYCNLHVAYNPKIKWIIKLLYPFRKLLRMFDRFGFVHKINAILMMEQLVREKK